MIGMRHGISVTILVAWQNNECDATMIYNVYNNFENYIHVSSFDAFDAGTYF